MSKRQRKLNEEGLGLLEINLRVWYFRQDRVSGSRPGRGEYTIDNYNI